MLATLVQTALAGVTVTVSGRAVVEGVPRADVIVRAYSESLVDLAAQDRVPFCEDNFYWIDFEASPTDPSWFVGEPREFHTLTDGRFWFPLAAGTRARIELVTASGFRAVLDPVVVDSVPDQELGDIGLVWPGTIYGRVALPAGATATPMSVVAWGPSGLRRMGYLKVPVDADGRFEIANAAAAMHHLLVVREQSSGPLDIAARNAVADQDPKGRRGTAIEAVQVGSRSRTRVDFDLTWSIACSPQFDVAINVSRRERVQIELVPTVGSVAPRPTCWTNDVGIVRAPLPALGHCHAIVRSAAGLPLAAVRDCVDLHEASRADVNLSIAAGRLAVSLPESCIDARAVVLRTASLDPSACFEVRLDPKRTRTELGFAGVGRREWTLEVSFHDSPRVRRYAQRLDVVAEQDAELAFKESDRLPD